MRCNHCGSASATPLFTKNGYQLVRCMRCGLAYIANPPDEAELARVYSAAANYHATLFDPQSADFAEMSQLGARHLAFVRRYGASGRLLDVGCSTGLFLDHARRAGFAVSGVEFSAESQAFARAHFGLEVVRGDVRAAPPTKFDVVTMFDVIEHVRDPAADLAEVAARLPPGGLLVLSTPDIDGLFPRASRLVAERIDHWPHPEPPYHLYQFSKRTMAAMLDTAGFDVIGARDTAMPLAYSFGSLATLARSPKMAAYATLFAPLAKLGPLIGMGDWFYMAARRR